MESEIISTKNGKIRGIQRISQIGDEYYSFQGIPFAKPPVGQLRFKDPIPAEPWQNVLNATQEKPIPHYKKSHFPDPPANEDCLYLNVYTPNLKSNLKPVIVFIYGGAFHSGSAATNLYGPDFLMQKEIILVTFNYRLGPLGFMSFKDPALQVPGNAALKDQRLALKWIKENIESFGGNPNNITAIGQSAGACSLHHHLLSPNSSGLFQRAVLLSGSATTPWGICEAQNMGERLARKLGWNGEGSEKEIYEFLMSTNADVLTKSGTADDFLTVEDLLNDIRHPFGPKIEPYKSDSLFCSVHPLESVKSCWSKDLEVIFGYTSNESLYFNDASFLQGAIKKGIPDIFLLPNKVKMALKDESKIKEATNKMKQLYHDFQESKQDVLNFFSDQIFLHGIHRAVVSRVQNCSGNTFLMRFDLDSSTLNHAKIRHLAANEIGSAHADELSYLFTNNFGPVPSNDTVELKNVQKMVDFIYKFAVNGSLNFAQDWGWKAITRNELPHNYQALKIEEPTWRVANVEEIERFKIWDTLYANE